MKTILYCRVSTSDQILDHQVTQARAAGFAVDEVVSDNGVSGVSTRLGERDQGKRLSSIRNAMLDNGWSFLWPGKT